MSADREQQIEELFQAALQCKAGERKAFLEQSQADPEIIREVTSRLEEQRSSSDLSTIPAEEASAGTLIEMGRKELIGHPVGSYLILSQLGRGGMGEVFLAHDERLDRKVALKFLPDFLEHDPAARRRFLREAKSAAALDHPFICKIYEVGEAEGSDFIAMEYVEGVTLKEKLKEEGALDSRQAMKIAKELAEALEAAHKQNIVHRDLKPSNLMITPDGHVKVMDFGLAKRLTPAQEGDTRKVAGEEDLTKPGSTFGTLAYMSPEQLRGKEVDTRSDLFCFGILFYEIITGRHPFLRSHPIETASAILRDDPPPLDRYIKEVPEALQEALTRMLAKNPDQRYQSVHEIRADLERVPQAGMEVLPQERIGRPGNLRPVWLALVVMLVVFATAGAIWWFQNQYSKSPASALAFGKRDWVLITDCENLTGEKIFNGSLKTALTVSIQQSHYINVFPQSRIQQTLKRMRREEANRLDVKLGSEIALREGIKALLACSISRVGNDYLLAAQILNPANLTSVFTYTSRAQGKGKVLEALDELSRALRQNLGESLASIAETDLHLPAATTSSLEALKALSEARRVGSNSAKIQLYQLAVQLDPNFALAHADLGAQYYMANKPREAEKHFARALKLLDRLTVREKLWIRAVVEDWRGNREKGIENYQTYLTQYPDDNRAWFRIGYAYMTTRRPSQAVQAFNRAVVINPRDYAARINIATCYNMMRKDQESLTNYQKAFALRPEEITGVFVNHEYGNLLIRMGRLDEAEQTFRKMTAQEADEKRSKGYRSLALLSMYRGRYAEAIDDLKESIRINQTTHQRLSEMRDRLYLAEAYKAKRKTAAFENEMAAAARLGKAENLGPSFLLIFGKVFARAGRISNAEKFLAQMKKRLGDLFTSNPVNRWQRGNKAALYSLTGEVELARKNYKEAIKEFELANSLFQDIPVGYLEPLAMSHFAQGDLDEALKLYKEIVGDKGKAESLGNERQEYWILAHYQIGKIYERKGDLREALEYYEKFNDIWKEGDPDLTALIEVRARMATLKSRLGQRRTGT